MRGQPRESDVWKQIFPPAINSDKPILIQYEPSRRTGTPLAQVLSDRFAILELTNLQTK
jgi:hypothetical protein